MLDAVIPISLIFQKLRANFSGVLLRFRKFGIATLADIEGMFMQTSIKA